MEFGMDLEPATPYIALGMDLVLKFMTNKYYNIRNK